MTDKKDLKKDSQKIIPINKYSIYEMKSAIDQNIVAYLVDHDFKESQTYSNMKIITGLGILVCTLVAYFYPRKFPDNYYAILVSVVGYVILSTIYWYIEKWIIKEIFYIGSNSSYFSKYRQNKHYQIKEMEIYSDIKDRTHKYIIWFKFTTLQEDHKIFVSEKSEIDTTTVCDERGYVLESVVQSQFVGIFNKCLSKFD